MDISSERTVRLQSLAAGGSGTSALTAGKPPVVLIVDDDVDNLQLACYIVEQAGYGVLTADNGKDALAQMQEHTVRLVLLDIILPDMDGYQVIQQIQQQVPGQPMPIVALTALASESEQAQMVAAGFSNFLCKPYAIDDLEGILRQYCPLETSSTCHPIAS
jgi:CheY-like chemotaxis protein